ncbi:MAG: caspase family protein [Spirochaetota bacterium]
MYVRYILIMVLSVLAGCSPFAPSSAVSRYAIVYGISGYSAPLPALSYAASDADAMAHILSSNGYSVTMRTDSAATTAQLSLDIAAVENVADRNDLVLFYFSGHGVDKETFSHCASNIGHTGVIADAGIVLYGDAADLSSNVCENTVDGNELSRLFSGVSSLKKVAILDSCYSGGFVLNATSIDATPRDHTNTVDIDIGRIFSLAAARYVSPDNAGSSPFLTISAAGDEAAWDGFRGHGVFTYFFMTSLSQGDLNGDGCITTLEAYAFTSAAIDMYWNVTNDGDWCFLPRISAVPVDYVLARPHP